MVAFTHSNLKTWIAPLGALAAGCIAALVALLIPATTLEDLVWNSGIAAILPVAEPPLGTTARALLALGGGGLVAAVTWSGLFLLFGRGGVFDAAARARASANIAASGAALDGDPPAEDDRIPHAASRRRASRCPRASAAVGA